MGRHVQQREHLFGLRWQDLARICSVNRTTAVRWKAGSSRIPPAAAQLVAQHFDGALGARAGSAWAGWAFGHDGLLYAPDLKRGFSPGDLMQLHFLQQLARYHDRLARIQAAVRAAPTACEPSPSYR